MCKKIKVNEIIDSSKLFWGNSALQKVLSDDERKALVENELIDWISTLYWAEGAAAKYALKMSKTIGSEREESWLKVYSDEFRHQTMLANWLNERNLTPNPPNLLVQYAEKQVKDMGKMKESDEIISMIEKSQLFFEELLHSLIRFRLPYIYDRDLKSILTIIYKDEADHLSKGRNEIKSLDGDVKGKEELLKAYADMIFPLHVGKDQLPPEAYIQSKKISSSIVDDFISESVIVKNPINMPSILKKFCRIPEYRCVACSPLRSDGLHLEPKFDKEKRTAHDELTFSSRFEGFNGLVHGGTISMALDEMMGYAVIFNRNQLPLTKSLEIKYLKPVKINRKYKVVSSIVAEDGQNYRIKAEIIDSRNETPCALAEGDFYVPKQKLASMVFGKVAENPVFKDMVYPDEAN